MNRKKGESGALAAQLKTALKQAKTCDVEIRAPIGSASRSAAHRLLKGFELAGFKSKVVDVVASPRAGVLVETSHQTAAPALSIQSAFLAAGMEADLIVHDKAQPDTIILHLGEESGPRA